MASALGASLLAVPIFAPQVLPEAQNQVITSAQAQNLSATQAPRSQPFSFADVVEQVGPAVVSIRVTSGERTAAARDDGGDHGPNNRERNNRQFRDLPNDPPFNEFFKRFFDQPDRNPFGERQQPRGRRFAQSQGSGFFISEDGYLVTNNHVVADAEKIEVVADDGTAYEAELVGTDERTDLALLKVKSSHGFKFVTFAKDEVRIGDWVVAVGNPFGLGGSVTAGIISARGRDIGSGPYDNFLQIDAPINRGNSGGPAFNLQGQVVGVNTAIFSPSGGSVGIGFAIPASVVENVVAALKTNGVVTRGWLGVAIQTVSADIAESIGLDSAAGAIVTQVTPGGPAEAAGLKEGDTILQVDGKDIEDSKDLARTIAGLNPDTTAQINVLRDGRERTIDVTLGTLPDNLAALQSPNQQQPGEDEQLGMTLAPADTVEGTDGEGVVIVDIDENSPAFQKGLRVGDQIMQIGGTAVDSPAKVAEQLRQARENGRRSVLLQVRSGDNPRFVALPIERG